MNAKPQSGHNDRFRLDGKVAIVTGAAAGIGRATALALARAGASVVLSDIDPDRLELAVQDLRDQGWAAAAVAGDIAAEDTPDKLASEATAAFGRLDILVNNAGIYPSGSPLPDADWTMVERTLAIDLVAPMRCMASAARAMEPGSAIVNVSSMESLRPSGPGVAHYGAAKAALNAATRAAAVDLAPKGIRVNAVLPGLVRTEGTSHVPDQFLEQIAARTPSRRVGNPEDIADAIVFLVSPASSYVNGQCLVVDGGITIAG